MFLIKSIEVRKFNYLGLQVSQASGNIIVSQNEFIKDVKLLNKKESYELDDELSESDLTLCRSTLGKLNWVATQTRPDISYEVSDLSSLLKERKEKIVLDINKSVRKVKRFASKIIFSSLGNLKNIKIMAYCDASFGGLDNGGSQGGLIIFVVGENNNVVPIVWMSRRIKRVVKSTHAAETLALVDVMEACVFYRSFLLDILSLEDTPSVIPIICKTDSSAVYQAAHSSTQILDKRLRIETSMVREMLENKVISALEWVPTDLQLADCLTKRGVMPERVLSHFGDPRAALP